MHSQLLALTPQGRNVVKGTYVMNVARMYGRAKDN
jgi:hypothetical protein